MTRQSTVKLSLTSAFDDKGTKAAEKAMASFERKAEKLGGNSSLANGFAETSIRAEQLGRKFENVGTSISSLGSTATKTLTIPIAAAATACIVSASKMESAFAKVRKTVDATDEEYQQLYDSAVEMSTVHPISAADVATIESLGAQLGISVDNLASFAETVYGLDIATDLDAETAATEMAQFANICSISQDQLGRVGSTVVELGNTSATTESTIMNMAMRIGAAGSQSGMTAPDILALSASLASLGMDAEAGGTAMSNTISQIGKDVATNSANLETWADLAGMSIAEFSTSWASGGDITTDTFARIVQGMAKTNDEGGNLTVLLDDLGISGIRQSDAMKRLAGSGDLLTKSVKNANQAYQDNTALGNEVANFEDTFSAKLEVTKNKAEAVAMQFGGPMVDALSSTIDAAEPLLKGLADAAEAFSSMDTTQQQTILGLAATAAAIGPVLVGSGKLVGSIGSIVSGYGKLNAHMAEWVVKANLGTTATKALSVSTKALKISVAAVAAVGISSFLIDLNNNLNGTTQKMNDADASFTAALESVGSYSNAMDNATSMVADMNATLTSTGSTISDVNGVISEKEAAITSIIAKALSEQRALRDQDIASISEYNAEIERLQAEKVQAYESGMQGVAASAQAEGSLSAQRAAEMTATAQDYYNSGLSDLDDYHNSRLQKLSEEYSLEGSMTEEQYTAAVAQENEYYNTSRTNLESNLSGAKEAVASNTDVVSSFSDEQVAAFQAIEDGSAKLAKGLPITIGDATMYLGLSSQEIADITGSMTDAFGKLANDADASLLSAQLSIATNGGKITQSSGEMVDKLLSQFEDLPEGMGTYADDAMRALAQGLDDQLGIDVANSTAQEIIDAYRSKTDDARVAGNETTNSFSAGLSETTQSAVSAALLVSGLSMDQFASAASSAGYSGDAAVTAFADRILNGQTNSQDAAAINAAAATGGLWTADGFGPADALGSSYAGTVGNWAEPAKKSGETLADNADSGAQSVDGSGAGDNFASGFINTIGDWAQSAWDAGWNFITNALDGGNAAQESRSPAKKTKEMAKWNALGFVNEMGCRESDAYRAGYSFVESSLAGSDKALAFRTLGISSQQFSTLPMVAPNYVDNVVRERSISTSLGEKEDMRRLCDRLDVLIGLVGDRDVILKADDRELARWVRKNVR